MLIFLYCITPINNLSIAHNHHAYNNQSINPPPFPKSINQMIQVIGKSRWLPPPRDDRSKQLAFSNYLGVPPLLVPVQKLDRDRDRSRNQSSVKEAVSEATSCIDEELFSGLASALICVIQMAYRSRIHADRVGERLPANINNLNNLTNLGTNLGQGQVGNSSNSGGNSGGGRVCGSSGSMSRSNSTASSSSGNGSEHDSIHSNYDTNDDDSDDGAEGEADAAAAYGQKYSYERTFELTSDAPARAADKRLVHLGM